MGGKASRRKGLAGEYLIRDYFRERGWVANRVPSSGAAEGFKGDVEISKDGQTLVAEVKFYKDAFKSIYGLVDATPHKLLMLSHAGTLLVVSYDFRHLAFELETEPPLMLFEGVEKLSRAQSKLFNLKKLVKTCDFLVIRINNRDPLFIRYWGAK